MLAFDSNESSASVPAGLVPRFSRSNGEDARHKSHLSLPIRRNRATCVQSMPSAVARSSFTETYGVVLGLYRSYSIHRESAVPTKIFYRGVDKALK